MGLTNRKADKIVELFYEYPSQKFTVREIAKKTKVPKSTAQQYLLELKEKKLIDEKNQAASTPLFKVKKVNFYIEKIVESGIIEKLAQELNPSCIILFGSIRKGDSTYESDIDLFIEAPLSKDINTQSYEKKIKHKIQLFIEKDIKNLQPQLFNNVINGIKLYGSFALR